MHNTYFKRKDF